MKPAATPNEDLYELRLTTIEKARDGDMARVR